MPIYDVGSEYELPEEVETCHICRYNAKNLNEITKVLPEHICLTICRISGCKKCELWYEMDKIANEIDSLKKQRKITGMKIKDRVRELEIKGHQIADKIDTIMEETNAIYDDY